MVLVVSFWPVVTVVDVCSDVGGVGVGCRCSGEELGGSAFNVFVFSGKRSGNGFCVYKKRKYL